MSSPQGLKPTPATPPSKDSPTSAFFNNLSPIKMISSRFSSQSFDSVDVPSPQPVFATPQNRVINSKLWRRSQTLALPAAQKISTGDSDLAATSSEYHDITRQFFPVASSQASNCSDKKYNIDRHIQSEVYRSPTKSVDDFLSVPIEDFDKFSCSPGFFVAEVDDLAPNKDMILASTRQMMFGNKDSSNNVMNSVTENNKRSDIVCVLNRQSNEIAHPQSSLNNSTVYEGPKLDLIVSNAEKMSNLKASDQNSSCQFERDYIFEEIEKNEANSNALVDSNSNTHDEYIAHDWKGSNRSCATISSAVSSSYLPETQKAGQKGSIYETSCKIVRSTQPLTDHQGTSGQMKDPFARNQVPYDYEDVAHHSRGMYKRLQFEDLEKQEQSVKNHFMPEAKTTLSNIETSHASDTNTSIHPFIGNVSCNYLLNLNSSDQNKGAFSMPSGIGLHLNAIGIVGNISSHMETKLPMKSSGRKGKSFILNSCKAPSQVMKKMMNSSNGNVDEGASVHLISNSDNSSVGSMGECNESRSPLEVEPLDTRMQTEFGDHHITPSEDSGQTSIGKKRMKLEEIEEPQKRCNCKRSKCLKLYCDCFAAGTFCNKACACQGCNNNSENEEIVCSTRQLIETRNPLAFAPKVVHASDGELKKSRDNKHITPPSARHKRGCNCKKSKCLKKYCECYQAGVGCSLGCRCEGCKNVFGTKEAYGDITAIVVEHQKSKEDVLKRDPDIKTLMALEEVNSKVSITNLPNNCFTPAQSTQTTTQSTWSPLDSPISAMNLAKNSSHEGDKCDQPTLSIVPYSHQFDSRSPASLSPEWNGLTDIYKGTQDELLCNLDDETPDILKDANSPVKMLKTGSPNQKRVSPPRKLQRDGGYSFSPGLKSGRKYVLHSIPQFPSLTPYRNSLIDMEPENQSDLKK